MISSDGIRGYNDMIILYLILGGPSYGYEISKAIKTKTEGKYLIKETTLYSAFTRLEKKRLCRKFLWDGDKWETADVLSDYGDWQAILSGEMLGMGFDERGRREI